MNKRMYKLAAATIEMGSPETAGKGIADIVKFLLTRISPASRPEAYRKMRDKIKELDPITISSKKTPASSSMGQSIMFIKTILIGHDSRYIKSVLENIIKNLN
jgi:hypothetical protein